MVILFSLTKFSSRLTVNNITSGERLIRKACAMSEANALGTEKLLMCISRNDEMVKQQSGSLKRLLKKHRDVPRKIVTDKLRSYGVAHRELIPDTIHDTSQHANNRAELSHQPIRVRERGMRRFKSVAHAQRFSGVHSVVYNLFNLARHLVSANHYRFFRMRAFASWKTAVA